MDRRRTHRVQAQATVARRAHPPRADDVLQCPCSGRRSVVAIVTDTARALLAGLGLATEPSTFAPARAPPQPDLPGDQQTTPGRSGSSSRVRWTMKYAWLSLVLVLACLIPKSTPQRWYESPDQWNTQAAVMLVEDLTRRIEVGDRVMARWSNGSWYPGTVTAIVKGRYDIAYDDGDKGKAQPYDTVRPGVLDCQKATGDLAAFCKFDCGAIKHADLRAMCSWKCEDMKHPDFRGFCNAERAVAALGARPSSNTEYCKDIRAPLVLVLCMGMTRDWIAYQNRPRSTGGGGGGVAESAPAEPAAEEAEQCVPLGGECTSGTCCDSDTMHGCHREYVDNGQAWTGRMICMRNP